MHFHRWGKWKKIAELTTKIGELRKGGQYHMERTCDTCGHVQVKIIPIP